jgi:predicted porin
MHCALVSTIDDNTGGLSIVRRYLLSAAPFLIIATAASAADLPTLPVLNSLPEVPDMTWGGITLYGGMDVGLTYQNHGAGISDSFVNGAAFTPQKPSSKPYFGLESNGGSLSTFGLKGDWALGDSWRAIAQLEGAFLPTSGELVNGPKSLVQQNGVPLANQVVGNDSAMAGQVFNREAKAGVSNPIWGTLTAGRQKTLLSEMNFRYDPMDGMAAFAYTTIVGASGGGGSAEERNLNNSVRYENAYGPVHGGAMYAFADGSRGVTYQFDGGFKYNGLSVDAVYGHATDEISMAVLSGATGTITAAQATALTAAGLSESNTLAGTVYNARTYQVTASYEYGQAKAFAGYNNILYTNPSDPLLNGAENEGYAMLVSNTAYTNAKTSQVAWGGVQYAVTDKFKLYGAYYYAWQNDYNGTAVCNPGGAGAANCAGSQDMVSIAATYLLNKNFATYTGISYSMVHGGTAFGYLATSVVSPTVGMRFRF